MYICGGFNVYPAEVEQALARLDGVAESAVIGVPDDAAGRGGQGLSGAPARATRWRPRTCWRSAGSGWPTTRCPGRWSSAPALPRNPAGKALKRLLREEPPDDREPARTGDPSAAAARRPGEPVRYERRGPVAVVTLNRPRYRNAQNSAMTYALDAAFARAVNDDEVAVIVLAGAGDHFCAGHDIGTPGRDMDQSFDRRGGALVGSRRQGRRGRPVRPGDGGLPGHVPPLAGAAQADHRDGAGRVHRRRADAGLGAAT